MIDINNITEEQLADWMKLAKAATAAPWINDGRCGCAGIYASKLKVNCFHDVERFICYSEHPHDDQSQIDWDFIATARIAMPLLIAEVRRLGEELAEVMKAIANGEAQ